MTESAIDKRDVKIYIIGQDGKEMACLDAVSTSELITELESRKPCGKCYFNATKRCDSCLWFYFGHFMNNFKPQEGK